VVRPAPAGFFREYLVFVDLTKHSGSLTCATAIRGDYTMKTTNFPVFALLYVASES
jgi:hypothetical protein